jgi:TPR repeat protein
LKQGKKNIEIQKKRDDNINLLRPSAEAGDIEAQYLLAVLFSSREGGAKPEYKQAYSWATKAALRGHREAQFLAGSLCENYENDGHGIQCKWEEMTEWYRLAAEQGEAEAQFRLAKNLYVVGHIGNNGQESYKWYLRSASQGNAPAQLFVGRLMYGMGEGVKKDLVKAYMWVRLATMANENWTIAENALKKIAKEMNSSEITKAEDLARKWNPKDELLQLNP